MHSILFWNFLEQNVGLYTTNLLNQLYSRCSKIIKENKKEIKLTVNIGQVMFSGEIYYYWPLNSVDKLLVKHRFSLHNLLRY